MDKLVSIIIPCKDESRDISGLLKDISVQEKTFDTEVIRITGIAPPGKARNMGVNKACGSILIFIDCDIRLGNEKYLANLVENLSKDNNIGAVCASLRLPPEASSFQLRYARQVLHCESPIVNKLTDVFTASSACFAIPKSIFLELGGFNENIIRGEDSELTARLIKAGYRAVLAPDTWCFHPPPANLCQLLETNFRYGLGASFVDAFYPGLNIDVHPQGVVYFSSRKTIPERIKRFFLSGCGAIVKMKNLLIMAKLSYAAGYVYGILKHRFLKRRI